MLMPSAAAAFIKIRINAFVADLYSGPDAIRVQLKFDIGDS